MEILFGWSNLELAQNSVLWTILKVNGTIFEKVLNKIQKSVASIVFLYIIALALCGSSSVGRAQPCHGWGREFEPRFPLQRMAR